MKKQLLLTAFTTVFFSCKTFSQTAAFVPIIDSSANTANNLVYDTGEVFVIFPILNQNIVSKTNDALAQNNITIYPNPITDVLNFIIPEDKTIHKITLSGIDGRILLDHELTTTQIDLSALPAGTYLLKTDLSETQTFKLVKR